jgi:hypothetical protein
MFNLTKKEQKVLSRCRKVKNNSFLWYSVLGIGIFGGVFLSIKGFINNSGIDLLKGWFLIIICGVGLEEIKKKIILIGIIEKYEKIINQNSKSNM